MSGILSSAMDFFRGAPAQQMQQQQAPANAQVDAPKQPDLATSLNQPAQPTPQGDAGTPGIPNMDQFKDLFTAPTPEQLAAEGKFDPNSLFAGLEPAKVREAVSQMSFTDNINSEQLAAIQAGGEGAVQALMQVMNTTSQNTMAQALISNAEMIKQAMGNVSGTLDTRISAVARKQAVSAAVHNGNPALNNPAIKPMVDALTMSFSMKNPQATPEQIRESVSEYMTKMAAVINPVDNTQQNGGIPPEYDFSRF